jgi:hypothetical protein
MYLRVDQGRASKSERHSPGRGAAAIFLVPGLVSGSGLGAAQTVSPSQLSIAQMIVNAANQYGVPPQLALGIASHESGFNPTLVNPNGGAAGVMQLMPATSQTMGVADPLDPAQNIDGGVRLLSQLLTKYNGDTTLALWAYSNGSGNVTAGGSNPANMPAQAAGLVSYVDAYQPPPSLDLPAVDLGSPADLTPADTGAPLIDLSGVSSFFGGIDPTTLGIAAAALALAFVWASE